MTENNIDSCEEIVKLDFIHPFTNKKDSIEIRESDIHNLREKSKHFGIMIISFRQREGDIDYLINLNIDTHNKVRGTSFSLLFERENDRLECRNCFEP